MNNDIPHISLGLPVYNGQNFLEQALLSILDQTFEDFELIICDNASTDKTEVICRKYEAQDSRIRYYRNEKNLGAAKNYNRVFKLSKGKYFAWVNHDDLYEKEYFEKCLNALEQQPSAVLAYSKSCLIDEQSRHIGELFYDLKIDSESPYKRFKRFHDCFLKPLTVLTAKHYPIKHYPIKVGIWIPVYGLMRREILSKTRLIGSHISSDTTLLEELAILGKFCLVPMPLFYKRDHSQRSVRLHRSYAKRIAWFDPETKGKLLFPRWKLLLEQFNVINTYNLKWQERLLCYGEIFRYHRWQWKALLLEIWINLQNILLVGKFADKKNKLPDLW